MSNGRMAGFIADLPKAELHLHIEGTLSPETVFRLADRNNIDYPYDSVEAIQRALDDRGTDLKGFLDHHYLNVSVIQTELDFFEITYELLRECRANRIVYAELFFDPQFFTAQGIPVSTVIEGIDRGRRQGAAEFEVEVGFIPCINRERSVESAFEMLDQLRPYRDLLLGLGMDSYEEGNPPSKFIEVYAYARHEGYRLTAHCDVDQTSSIENMWECLDVLGVDRIDHGVNAIEDLDLVEELKGREIALTTCPVRLDAQRELEDIDRIRRLFDLGVRVTINTDDPTEFASGFLTNLLTDLQKASGYTDADLVRLMENAFEASWLPEERKTAHIQALHTYAITRGVRIIGGTP